MGFKIKNSLTGEFEKLPILTLKGEKGETGGVEEYNKVDYMGNKYETLKQANDANVEYAVKTAIGEFNYLDYDGQHITATDTIEGQAKSAILKGQTLVNLWDNIGQHSIAPSNFVGQVGDCFKKSTKYLLKYNVLQTNTNNDLIVQYYHNGAWVVNEPAYMKLNKDYYILTTPSVDFNDIRIFYADSFGTGTVILKDIMLIEYQEGMENWNIPYFEGMQSVKMPVLTTTGKNTVNEKTWEIETEEEEYQCLLFDGFVTTDLKSGNPIIIPVNVKKGKKYTLKCKNKATSYFNYYYLIDDLIDGKVKTNRTRIAENNTLNSFVDTIATFTADGDYKYLHIDTGSPGAKGYIVKNTLQLEESSSATTYEPYKTNILSTPEEVVLRGFDSMKDTLNLNTGEYTKRIGELTLNGSEYWQYENNTDGTTRFNLPISDFKNYDTSSNGKNLINDKLPKAYFSIAGNTYGVTTWCNHVVFFTEHTNVNDFKQWLSQNPTTIQYELATPVIKTVDLSDNHVYSYKDVTHYDCSSAEGSLVPTLSIDVPTDVQATIAQQRETIQTLNSENERLNQIQEALKASMLDSQVQLMNLSWNTDFEVFTLRESIAPKDFLLASRTGSNIDKFSQAKFIIENDCPDLEKLNSQIEYYFSKDVFSQEQFEELTYLISIVKGENGCEY